MANRNEPRSERRDPEEDPVFHAESNKLRRRTVLFYGVPLVLFMYFGIANGYRDIEQLLAMLWLGGCILLRFLLLVQNFIVDWENKCTSCVFGTYLILNIFWFAFGGPIAIIMFVFTIDLFSTKYTQMDILVVATFVIDCIIVQLYLRYYEKLPFPQRQVQPDNHVDIPLEIETDVPVDHVPEYEPQLTVTQAVVFHLPKPQITTHGFYDVCSICTDKFTEKDTVRELPCKHIFHPNCIDPWLLAHSKCPTCRVDIDM